jgi:hypothetical protein
MNTENTEVGKSKDTLTPAPEAQPLTLKRHRQFTAADVDQICKSCARGLTESESVRLLGKTPSAWFSFKSKASRSAQFAAKLEQFQGRRIDQLLSQIEAAGAGIGRREPDWRASLACLKVMSQRRFGDHAVEMDLSINMNQRPNPQYIEIALRALHLGYAKHPDAEAKGIVSDVQLRRRDRHSLAWLPGCGFTRPEYDNITPALRERVRAMLDADKVIDLPAEPPKQLPETTGTDSKVE